MAELESKAARRPRLLIVVIAHHAATTLRQILARIPSGSLSHLDCEVLVVTDASSDRTFEVARAYRGAHPELPLTLLHTQLDPGYGGNQKVGCAYAIRQGFDCVALLHGDGRYAPETLPALAAPLLEGRADAVFGSRMPTHGSALHGGMPLHELIRHRVFTACQNLLLGTRLSALHTDYRMYSVAALERIPLQLNSDDFRFATEIIIQLTNAKLRIVELPMPGHDGDESSRINELEYAKNLLSATLQNTLHRTGLSYQRRYDPDPDAHPLLHYDLKLGYPSSHSYALERVPNGASVLDIGGGPCGIARELLRKDCHVTVVDQAEPPAGALKALAALGTAARLRIHVQDLELSPRFTVDHDYILMLDIIEHLRSPERFLERLRKGFDEKPRTVILTTPNVAFCAVRLLLLLGQFNYSKSGILDITHTRLFTFHSLEQLLGECGFRIRELRGVPAPFPKVVGDGPLAPLGSLLLRCNLAAIGLSKQLFSYQIYVVAETTPDVDHVLRSATRAESPREASIVR